MAGLFRAPKPEVIQPQQQPQQATATPVTTSEATEAARVETRSRARGGISGTIATSARGVLTAAPVTVTRKSLLGE